jgi:hypothetical protein
MKNYQKFSYFESRPDIVKIFEDLEAYHDFCRLEARRFDPADLYNRHSKSYTAFITSMNIKTPYYSRSNHRSRPSKPKATK